MCLHKAFLLSGAAALVSSAALAAESPGNTPPLRASDVVGVHGVRAPAHNQLAGEPAGPSLCGTKFGAELSQPDGLISWNDTTETGYNTAAAADFTCSVKTKVKQVWVTGWFGTNPEQYNVTFYKNSGADGSDEPNDSQIVCAYTGLIGAGDGGYEGPVLTQLKLPAPCKFKAGKKYLVSVQNNDSAGPWYWEVTSQLSGTQADWVDRNNKFSDGCTAFDDDRYLVDCLGYTYPDYML